MITIVNNTLVIRGKTSTLATYIATALAAWGLAVAIFTWIITWQTKTTIADQCKASIQLTTRAIQESEQLKAQTQMLEQRLSRL